MDRLRHLLGSISVRNEQEVLVASKGTLQHQAISRVRSVTVEVRKSRQKGESEMGSIPSTLREFMDTLRLPPGVDEADFLIPYDGLMNGDPAEVAAVDDSVFMRDSSGCRLNADIIVPLGNGPYPVVVYFHGRGWALGTPKTHRRLSGT